MIAKVAKEWTFHAAHQLPNHDGACQRLHGHSYKLEVSVSGWVKPANGDPDEGMVLDFGVLKDIYMGEVEPFVEHQDLNVTLAGVCPLTTSENVAGWMLRIFHEALSRREIKFEALSVKLWETPTSHVEVAL